MNRRWSALVVGGILVLGACGREEAQPADEATDAAEDEPESSAVDSSDLPEAASGTASPLLSQRESTSFVFNETGEYPIHCEAHPNMTMKVVVEEGVSTSGKAAVEIADLAFGEETLTVAPGTVVTWINQDTVQHNVFFE